MKNIYYKILSYFPNKNGQEAFINLQKSLSQIGGINFNIRRVKDESGEYFIAESVNLEKKHIVTTGKSLSDLDYNIKDAIFTSFHVPAYYCNFDSLVSPINNELKLQYAAR